MRKRIEVEMAQFIGTFERKEKKYVLDAFQVAELKDRISKRLQLDEYGRTRIDSLYFDTPGHDIIARSIEKPLYKEKLRVRAYGDVAPDSPVFVEIKKKYKGIVYKRRVRMSRAGAQAYLSGMAFEQAQAAYPIKGGDASKISAVDAQIAREIDAFCKRYPGIAPSMVISCQREAWKAIDKQDPESDVRITFDEEISYVDVNGRMFDYDAAVAAEGKSFALAPENVVMEVKCAGAYPLWLVEALDECGIAPQSFSKYGSAYSQCCARHAPRTVRRIPRSTAHTPQPAPKRESWRVFNPLRKRVAAFAR